MTAAARRMSSLLGCLFLLLPMSVAWAAAPFGQESTGNSQEVQEVNEVNEVQERVEELRPIPAGAAEIQEAAATDATTSDAMNRGTEDPEPGFRVPGWLVEQSIYIPFEEIRDKFEAGGRGVFIPYEQFDQLWQRAHRQVTPPAVPEAPVDFSLVASLSRAKLERNLVDVQTELTIDFPRTGWHQVPLALSGCALLSASIDDQPARITTLEDGGFALLYRSQDPNERRHLKLNYVKSIPEAVGENRVVWPVPRAAINRWEISIDQAEVDISVSPAVVISQRDADIPRATDPPASEAEDLEATDTGTDGDANEPGQTEHVSSVTALLGNSPTIDLRWTPRSVGAEGLAALLTAETFSHAEVQRNLLRVEHRLRLQVQRASIQEVEVQIPADFRVVNVLSDSVKRWQMSDADERLQIELFEALQGELELRLELEQELAGDPGQSREVRLAPPQVLLATRQPGQLIVRAESGLRVEVGSATGLSRVNDAETNRAVANQADQARLTFRYSAVPYELVLRIEQWATRVLAQQQVVQELDATQVVSEVVLLLDVQHRGLFTIPLIIPAEQEILQISGTAAEGYQPVQVEKYQRAGDDPTAVHVQLSREAIGPVALMIRVRQPLPGTGLTDTESPPLELALQWPMLPPAFAETLAGKLLLSTPESLNVVAGRQSELRAVDAAAAFPDHRGESRQLLAYEFVTDQAQLRVTAARRRPQVLVDQVAQITVDPGVLRYQVNLDYDIRFSPVTELRLDVPAEVENRLRITGGRLNHQRLVPQPDDVAQGQVAWKLVGPTELLGRYGVQLTWELPIDEVAIGVPQAIAILGVTPREVERSRGQWVFQRSELFDIQIDPSSTGLRPIDPSTDLYGNRRIEGAVAALEFVGDWSLQLNVARFELYDLKRSSIPRSLVRAVWLRNNELSVQALYQVRSVGQRIVVDMPPGFDPQRGFDSTPVRVEGQPTAVQRGAAGELIIPLGNRDRDQELLVEIRYSMPIVDGEVPVPTFPADCAVQKTTLMLYLPHEWTPLQVSGPWSDPRLEMTATTWDRLMGRGRAADRDWLSWVATSAVPIEGLQTFETDGRPYTFTTLRPESGSDGALRVVSLRSWIVQMLGVGLVLLLGLLLVRRSWTARLLVAATLIGAWIVAATLWPLAVETMDYQAVGLSSLLVLGLWLVGGFFNIISRDSSRSHWKANQPTSADEAAEPATASARSSDATATGTSHPVDSRSAGDPPPGSGSASQGGDHE